MGPERSRKPPGEPRGRFQGPGDSCLLTTVIAFLGPRVLLRLGGRERSQEWHALKGWNGRVE